MDVVGRRVEHEELKSFYDLEESRIISVLFFGCISSEG